MPAIRFFLPNLLLVANLGLLLHGGIIMWAGFIAVLLLETVLDELSGDALEEETKAPLPLLTGLLYACLPLLALNSLLFAFYFSPAEHTWIGALLSPLGIDFDAARRSSNWFDIAGALMTLGVHYGKGINVGHELVHQTTDRRKTIVGRWLCAFSFESAFSLHHMTGHHINAGLWEDTGTARRGESLYGFIWRATIGTTKNAWNWEVARLARRNLPVWSRHNRFLTGQAMTFVIGVCFWLCGGWAAVAAFTAVGLQGRFYLDAAGYVEHYGLVRAPDTRFEPRHAWNSYRRLSNSLLYNLARHAHHHLWASDPYYKLRPDAGAPVLPHGYMTMFSLSLIPPLFNYVMRPHLENWDRTYATEAERRYAAQTTGQAWGLAPAE